MFRVFRDTLLLTFLLCAIFNFALAEGDSSYNPDYTVLAVHYSPDYSLLNKEAFSSNVDARALPTTALTEGISPLLAPEYEVEDLIEEDIIPIAQSSSAEISDPFSTLSEDASSPNNLVATKSLPTTLLIKSFLFDPILNDSGYEFIELYNESYSSIELTDYSIQTTTLKNNFELGMIIAPHSSFTVLLGDTVTTNSSQMLWKSGSLKNSTDTIYLVGSHTKVTNTEDPAILDYASYGSLDFTDFTAGKIYQRKLKDGEACPPDLASTSLTYCRGHLAPSFKLITDIGVKNTTTSGGIDSITQLSISNSDQALEASPVPGMLLIYRFLFDAVGADDGKEFIELYNESDSPVDLASYSIQTSTSKKNFESGMVAEPHSSFFILLGNTSTTSSNQMLWKSGSLNNSTGTIYLTNSHIQVPSVSDPTILDSIIYNSTNFSNFAPGKIYQRKLKDDEACPFDIASLSKIYCRGHAFSFFKLVDF